MRIHSVLSEKCTPKESPLGGVGVFAKENIKKGELIAVWGGVIYSKSEVQEWSETHPGMLSHPFGVYKDFYMGPLNPSDPLDDAEKFNHSCDANAGVKGQIIVVAKKDIATGTEIFFNYETVETDPTCLGFECKCGASNCRKIINGSAWKDEKFRNLYKGYFSTYIEEMINSSDDK